MVLGGGGRGQAGVVRGGGAPEAGLGVAGGGGGEGQPTHAAGLRAETEDIRAWSVVRR